ncbi:hypothetical protein Q31a_34000 [Aureliella helgolandensis]|uniref:Potassium channel protein n=2 Tax=Aureliella helgolandensis TaxID=2527968 RepID=A0A518G902_9BACT|nr:hypothetical protein Q31a_34000 [Aureliella helgolandensis]
MFYLSVLFLALVACIMVLWIDVPRVLEHELTEIGVDVVGAELGTTEATPLLDTEVFEREVAYLTSAYHWGRYCGLVLLALWPIFLLEQGLNYLKLDAGESMSQRHSNWWLSCFVPPLRMCARHRDARDKIWLPRLGWQVVDWRLQRHLEKVFSIPMVWIALLILPVLGVQFLYKDHIVEHPNLRALLHIGTGLIWFAFATEFIVMVSVTNKKFQYCKRHWLDLLIILLPLISFLRTLRILRATKLAKIGKLQQLTRVVRVYRVRGVAMRAVRALLILEVVHRVFRIKPETRLRKLEALYAEKTLELQHLQEEMETLRLHVAATTVAEEASTSTLSLTTKPENACQLEREQS